MTSPTEALERLSDVCLELKQRLEAASGNVEYENRLRRRAIEELREADERVAQLREELERERLLRLGAEEQASRAIARLANVVETVRTEAALCLKHGNYDRADALRLIATKLQNMELP